MLKEMKGKIAIGSLLPPRTRPTAADETPAFAGIAEHCRRAGDLDRAIGLCRDGLRRFPSLLSARVTLGWALLDQGRHADARTELEQVLRRAPDNLAAIRGLAALHDRVEGSMPALIDGKPWSAAAHVAASVDTVNALRADDARGAVPDAMSDSGVHPSVETADGVTARLVDPLAAMVDAGRAAVVAMGAQAAPVEDESHQGSAPVDQAFGEDVLAFAGVPDRPASVDVSMDFSAFAGTVAGCPAGEIEAPVSEAVCAFDFDVMARQDQGGDAATDVDELAALIASASDSPSSRWVAGGAPAESGRDTAVESRAPIALQTPAEHALQADPVAPAAAIGLPAHAVMRQVVHHVVHDELASVTAPEVPDLGDLFLDAPRQARARRAAQVARLERLLGQVQQRRLQLETRSVA